MNPRRLPVRYLHGRQRRVPGGVAEAAAEGAGGVKHHDPSCDDATTGELRRCSVRGGRGQRRRRRLLLPWSAAPAWSDPLRSPAAPARYRVHGCALERGVEPSAGVRRARQRGLPRVHRLHRLCRCIGCVGCTGLVGAIGRIGETG